jgi:uncharacterized membrane protein YeaQ/YmgE (transglycosylase-associated protein family)
MWVATRAGMQSLVELLIGIAAGGLAKLLIPWKGPGDLAATVLLAVIGSFMAGAFARTSANEPTFIAASIGALAVAATFRFVMRRREGNGQTGKGCKLPAR